MTEDEARRIFLDADSDLVLAEAFDLWVRDYSLKRLTNFISNREPEVVEFILTMAKYHYGSFEVNNLLTKLKCFPYWMYDEE